MSVNQYFSWQSAEWARLWEPEKGPPQSTLIAGTAGIGKSQFALALAQRMLCETQRAPTEPACGVCPSCKLFALGNHPDFRHVMPESEMEEAAESSEPTEKAEKKKASAQILIGQIRALDEFVYVGAYRGGRRVIVIEPTEMMNVAAANSLLKILEEPPASIYFILITSRIKRLLPTLRSRCRILAFRRPESAQANDWLSEQGGGGGSSSDRALAAELLALSGGAPISALEEMNRGRGRNFADVVSSLLEPASDFLQLASRWESQLKTETGLKMDELVIVIQKTLHDLLSHKMNGRLRFLAGRQKAVAALTARSNIENLFNFHKELLKIRALAQHPLNPRLFLDDLAARYTKAIAATGGGRA